MKNKECLVAIRCTIFNHEPYLRDCLSGFVMQKTNFKFVAIVHDDCSTDKSADIIREYAEKYPDIIKPLYETENQYSKHDGSLQKIMNDAIDATGARYIALCEGDDYWTDPLKLQKQVDFLESHPDYVLTCHRYQIFNQNDESWENADESELFNENLKGFSFTKKDNLNTWLTKTMTLVYRREIVKTFPDYNSFKYWRDDHLNYYLLKQGNGYCFSFNGAVYRRHNAGVFSSLSSLQQLCINFRILQELYNANVTDFDLSQARLVTLSNLENVLRIEIVNNPFRIEIIKVFFIIVYGYIFDLNIKGLIVFLWHVFKSFAKI